MEDTPSVEQAPQVAASFDSTNPATFPKAFLSQSGLLGAWMCIANDATDQEVVEAASRSGIPEVPDAWVIDRLYGGFKCSEPDRQHVYIGLGEYTYTRLNGPNDAETRLGTWKTLIRGNRDQYLTENLRYADDRPNIEEVLKEADEDGEAPES